MKLEELKADVRRAFAENPTMRPQRFGFLCKNIAEDRLEACGTGAALVANVADAVHKYRTGQIGIQDWFKSQYEAGDSDFSRFLAGWDGTSCSDPTDPAYEAAEELYLEMSRQWNERRSAILAEMQKGL